MPQHPEELTYEPAPFLGRPEASATRFKSILPSKLGMIVMRNSTFASGDFSGAAIIAKGSVL